MGVKRMASLTLPAVVTLLSAALGSHAPLAGATSCDDLAHLALPHTRITQARVVPAGESSVPAAARRFLTPRLRPTVDDLPAFCRVTAEIAPTTDSDIRIKVWMPVAGWNGRLVGVGNGGWSGFIRYDELAAALRGGYAAASTNTGHDGAGHDASFALGHPEKLIDYGYRAVHEMTVEARTLVMAFYGRAAQRAYWAGCSSGGRQGLIDAQRFPLDYDGIVAGAPANYMTHLVAGDVWTAQATHASAASYIPPGSYALIHKAALDACDAVDGLEDGLIGDPLRCHFDPGVLLCRAGQQTGCLTAPQVEAARKIYAGAVNPRTGESVFPGLEPGSEGQWRAMAGPPEPPIVASYFKYMVFEDSTWDYRTLDFDADVARADSLDTAVLNATDPDLGPFIAHGGRLLLYHGWSDGLIAPENTVHYYERVVKTVGSERASEAVRLFMVPGMYHCDARGGPSPVDLLRTLDRWMATREPPQRIVTAHVGGSEVHRTRPLCPFPQVARYTGSGNADKAASFVCRSPDSQRVPSRDRGSP